MASSPSAKAKAEPSPELGSLPEPHGNTKHGLRSKVPIIRALLPPLEAEVWDTAPVPADCPPVLEEVFREYCVLKYRVHAFDRAPGRAAPKDMAALAAMLRAYHIPLRGLIKAVEVHARMKEAEQTHDMGDSVLAYLRTLPAHRLEDYMMNQEAPRFDPVTGGLLATGGVPRETQEDEDASDVGGGSGELPE